MNCPLLPLALLAVLPVTAGCLSEPRSPSAPGMTRVMLENRVDSPCELAWASVRVDDRPIERMVIAPEGSPPAQLERSAISPGKHAVSISAVANCEGMATTSVLQVTQAIYLGEAGGQIAIVVTRDPEASSGLAAGFAIAGGEVLASPAEGAEIDCRARIPIDRTICQTEASLARAHADRDVVLMLCISDKLGEMRLLRDAKGPSASREGGAGLGNLEADTAGRMRTLAAEAERCIGLMAGAESEVRVERAHEPVAPTYR